MVLLHQNHSQAIVSIPQGENMLSKKSDSHCRDQHPHLKQKSQNEVAYTDVVDLIGQNNADIKKCQEVLKKTNLKLTRTRQSTHRYKKAKKGGKK